MPSISECYPNIEITASGSRPSTRTSLLSSRRREGSELEAAGERVEDVLQALQRADVAVAGGRLLEAEHFGGLGIAELLEVPQREDLAIDGVHAVEDNLEAGLQLGADGGLAGGGQAAEELVGQRDGGGLGDRPAM